MDCFVPTPAAQHGQNLSSLLARRVVVIRVGKGGDFLCDEIPEFRREFDVLWIEKSTHRMRIGDWAAHANFVPRFA